MDQRIESVVYVLRLDGIFLFAVNYRLEPTSYLVYWDAVKIADYLRRFVFGFVFLPRTGSREADIFHTPTHIEDLCGNAYLARLAKLDIPIDPDISTDPNSSSIIQWMISIASNDVALASARRYTQHPLREKHYALLHLKAQMGRRKNEIMRMLDIQEGYENKRKLLVPTRIVLGAAAVLATLLILGAYELIFPTSLGLWENAKTLFDNLRSLNHLTALYWLPVIVAITLLRLLHWWYIKSYRRRVFVLTNGILYFLNCSHYGSVVAKIYGEIALKPQLADRFAGGPFYDHARSFETTAEDLRTRLQHEQMRFRDLGIRYALIAAVCALVARYLSGTP